MKGKSLATAILTAAIALLAAYSGAVSVSVAGWFGAASMLITMLLNSPIFASGTWPKGWNWLMWVNNIGGLVIMWFGALADTANPVIPPHIITMIVATINAILMALVKTYSGEGGQSILGDRA